MIVKTKLVLSSGLALLLIMSAGGLGAKEKKDKDEKKKSFTVSKWAYKRLSEAHELLGAEKFDEALEVANSLVGRRRLNNYEQALTWQTLGYVYSATEKFPKAIESFEKCLAFDALPEGVALDIQFSLGQLYLASRKYTKAANTLESWIKNVENPKPDAKYLLAMAYVQMKDYRNGLRWANLAVAAVEQPKENWLQLQLSVLFELKRYKKAKNVLEKLVTRFPKKSYWTQLSAIYAEIKQEMRAAAVLELAYYQGYLTTESELKSLASYQLHFSVPTKAIKVLQKGIEQGVIKKTSSNLRTLADAYLRARDLAKAIEPLSQAAELAEKGELYIRLAEVHFEREEWKQAASAIQAAIKKGRLNDEGNAYILLGIAQYNSKKGRLARQTFIKAQSFKNAEKRAKQWIRVIDTQKKV